MTDLDNTRPSEEERLNRIFHNAGMSVVEIASALNTTQYEVKSALNKYDISRSGRVERATYKIDREGYEKVSGTNKSVRVHQLQAIVAGEDPHDVFDQNMAVHHKNGVKWDNRTENLELMTLSEHAKHHWENGDMSPEKMRDFTDEEMIGWINAFVEEFGYVPTRSDLDGWPGPVPETYRYRFGTWREAMHIAGWKLADHPTDMNGRRVGYEDPTPVGACGVDT